MGSLFSDFWTKQGHEVFNFGRDLKDIDKISDCEIIVFSVPKDSFEEVLNNVKDFLNKDIEFVFDRQDFLKPRDLANSILSEEYPNMFSRETAAKWPSVMNGFISESTALKILDTYINGRT